MVEENNNRLKNNVIKNVFDDIMAHYSGWDSKYWKWIYNSFARRRF